MGKILGAQKAMIALLHKSRKHKELFYGGILDIQFTLGYT